MATRVPPAIEKSGKRQHKFLAIGSPMSLALRAKETHKMDIFRIPSMGKSQRKWKSSFGHRSLEIGKENRRGWESACRRSRGWQVILHRASNISPLKDITGGRCMKAISKVWMPKYNTKAASKLYSLMTNWKSISSRSSTKQDRNLWIWSGI